MRICMRVFLTFNEGLGHGQWGADSVEGFAIFIKHQYGGNFNDRAYILAHSTKKQ